ncbi:MAG: NUDIX domain-containing protein [Candidatus Gottesmanbacteria bacterium]|nr:NUDIX domain-containing protein [Candidatus Gottesmanbacteria bacterium]
MKIDRFKMIASGYLLLIRNGKILLLRRFQTGYEDGKYSVPAGHVEDNESLLHSTCREICEEVGLVLKPKDLKLVHVMHRKSNDIRMDFFFTTDKKGLVPKNTEPHKADDLRWFFISKLPTNTIPYIRAAINKYRKKIFYSEFGWK